MDLTYRQMKIQEKRKQTHWREFVMEVASWMPLNLYKWQFWISRYPETGRILWCMKTWEYENLYPQWCMQSEYDKLIPFFENFSRLWKEWPKPSTIRYWENENSDFAETVFWAKNAYLSFIVGQNAENIMYSTMVYVDSINVLNSLEISQTSNCYYSKIVEKSQNIFYSRYISNSFEIWFSSNLVWCQECVLCDGLENQSYCINNKRYEKKVYEEKKRKILSDKDRRPTFCDEMNRIGDNIWCENATWLWLQFCRNVSNAYETKRISHGNNIIFWNWIDGSTYCYDCVDVWINSHHLYGVFGAGQNCENIYCSTQQSTSTNIFYSYHLENCSFCFWCIWLKNQSYCILNKQFTKADWYNEVEKICIQMESDWTLWKFFPSNTNPYYFNDTAAYLIDESFTKQEVEEAGYLWRDEKVKVDIPVWAEVILTSKLWDYEWYNQWWEREISPDILKKVIQDEEWNMYRVIPIEYKFLKKYGLPLPRTHRLTRLKQHLVRH